MPTWITVRLVGYVLAALLGAGLLLKAYNVIQDHFAQVEDVKTRLSNERILRERADVSLEVLKKTIVLEDQHRAVLEQMRLDYEEKIKQTRDEAAAQVAVLQDRERLKRVTDAKPGLVEKLANKATEERFNELEAIINN